MEVKVLFCYLQDVAGKILSLSHKGPRGICILSANGAVSNVTIRQPGSSGGILTYEVSSLPRGTLNCNPFFQCLFIEYSLFWIHATLKMLWFPQFGSIGVFLLQGRFEILSLSGSFTINDAAGGVRSRTGGLSVSLAGPDGRVIGGGVAGLLLAASPIQVRHFGLSLVRVLKLNHIRLPSSF